MRCVSGQLDGHRPRHAGTGPTVRPPPGDDGPAMEAVSQWEYTPTLVDGKPVPVTMTVTVTFRLS